MVQSLAVCSAVRTTTCGHAYARREPEKTALCQVFHRHLPSFERIWADIDFVAAPGDDEVNAALVPPPKLHVTAYSGVLASNSRWHKLIIPETQAMKENDTS